MIFRANDKYRANLRSTWIATPPDTTLQVNALPLNLPTLVTVGWGATYETVFIVEGKSGTDPSNYALTGVTRLKGANENLPVDASVNCLNNEEFFNQFVSYMGVDWKGEWNSTTTYKAGEGISYHGSSYVALVDTTNDEPPLDGTWSLVNKRGATWTYGSGVPDNDDGDDEDFYLDVTANDIYVKEGGVWGIVTNIKGDQGIQGIQGVPGTGGVIPSGVENNIVIIDANEEIVDSGKSINDMATKTGTETLTHKTINANDNTLTNIIPAGTINMFGGSSAPTGWLICNGNAVSRTTYSSLFSIIGTTYGTGDGSTTFNLPNLKGKVVVGLDSGDTSFDALGETGGEKTHTLSVSEMPSHTHAQNAHGHNVYVPYRLATSPSIGYNGDGLVGSGGATALSNYIAVPMTTANNTIATNQNTGGGNAHNNLQPYITLNYIIKT